MGAAFGWGLLSASSLVIGSVVALLIRIPVRVIGLIMGFGAGVLISADAFDLVEEAAGKSTGNGALIAGLFSGCLVFAVGDWAIDHLGGGDRKDPTGAEEKGGGSSLSIVLGSVLDGIPESISSTSGLLTSGWLKSRILWMWIGIAVVSALASLAGYSLFQDSSPGVVAFVLTFAAGAILTMLANTMMPEAYEDGGRWVGVATTIGFAVAFTIHVLD